MACPASVPSSRWVEPAVGEGACPKQLQLLSACRTASVGPAAGNGYVAEAARLNSQLLIVHIDGLLPLVDSCFGAGMCQSNL